MLEFIWQRYFLKAFVQVFCLFLVCFYGLYVLIDYATHTSALASHTTQIDWKDLLRYYFYVFANRAEILVPIAILIAFIKRLTTLNSQQELAALMAGGISLKKLLKPFLLFAVLCSGLLYLNTEFLLPQSLKKVRSIESTTKHQEKRRESDEMVHHLLLEDGSLLVYQSYNHLKERFFDAYWIPSIQELYRIKFLYPGGVSPVGFYVDYFKRNEEGELLQNRSFKELDLTSMHFNKKILQSTLIEPDFLSLSALSKKAYSLSSDLDEKESKILTAFYWKLVMPLLCLLAILAPAPSCVYFSRQQPLFFIFVINLFGLLAFYMLMDASRVLAIRQVLSPEMAILAPFAAIFCFFTWRYRANIT